MHIYYRITVKSDYRWANVRVSGRSFSKSSVEELPESEVNDEILNSPLLTVEVIESEPEKPRRARKAKEEGDG